MVDKLEAEEADRRHAMRHHEQMLDAEKMCVPCKLCGGDAKISDAGTGAGYYIECSNSTNWRDSTGCLISERRLGGWAYNVMEWWNRLHAATPANGEQVERADEADRVELAAFLATYANEADGDLVNRNPCDPLLTWGILRRIAATLSTPTEDARERVKALEEALEPFAREADEWEGYVQDCARVLYIDTDEETPKVTIGDFRRARNALGNKETDRHG